ncbi:hypothetical protein LTR85_009320 [Meristemomyces frigidus]|nr:hypothetical protein LTR85_009320 [Meristemomyces frigidus]
MGLILPALILSAVLYAAWGAIANYRQLRQFKGPPLAAFSRAWLFWKTCNADLYKAEQEAIEKYGSVARVGPNLLVTDDADLVRHMNAPGSKWTRSGWFTGLKLDPRRDTVFSTRDEKEHAELKAKETGAYYGRDIEPLEPNVDARIVDMLSLIREKYDGVTMDLAKVARFFTLDVLSTIAFGRPFGFMAANEDLWDYDQTTSSFLQVLEWTAYHKSVRWLIHSPFMQKLAAPKVTDKRGMGPMLGFARQAVAERFGDKPVVKNDMLGHFVSKGLDQLQCEAEASLQIVAGSDSTTTVLRSTLFHLIATPVAYVKLSAEIDAAARDGSLSYPIVTYAETQKLPCLQAVIWEGLRMYPPLFGMKMKCAPPGGETIKGIYFPEGCELGICDDSMQKNKKVFGADANLFRPARWIEADAETIVKYRRVVDTGFSSGRFLCLGRHIAMMELHKALVELIRNFDWAIANPTSGISTVSYGVHIQRDMNVIASPKE